MSEEKLLSFEGTDFKFVAAYNAYTKLFQESEDEEKKSRLNELINNLHTEQISYSEFYSKVNEGTHDERRRFHRSKINTSRKFAYRKEEQKTDRIRRHK
ncbi:MAG: hypothetical protein NWE89_00355 [Candidatus Bathyarchaeota archaeon]|nr:hypothetical protein [Candidatus Bathyarchaeota archaeon]